MTYLRKALQTPRLYVVRDAGSIRAARESTRKELLSLRVTCKQLTALIARYDAMLLALAEDHQ